MEMERDAGSAQALSQLVDEWGLEPHEVDRLLGRGDGQDQAGAAAERIAGLYRIARLLHMVYGPALARQWVRLENSNGLFGGTKPLDYLLAGGAPAAEQISALLRGRASGAG